MTAPDLDTRISVLDEHDLTKLYTSGHLMTVLVEVSPTNPEPRPIGTRARLGYVLEGEMVFELEGEVPASFGPGETLWNPGGDLIHYQAANPRRAWCRFVVVMACKPRGTELTFVDADELAARRHRRHPGPLVDPRTD